MNRTEKKIQKEKSPITNANIISKLFFCWLKDVFKIGLKRPIEEHEIFQVRDSLESKQVTDKLARYWDEELKKKDPSVLRILFKAFGMPVLTFGLAYSLLESTMRVIQPLCLGRLVSYFAIGQTEVTSQEAYLYALGIILTSAVDVFGFHPFIYYIFQMGCKMRLGCTGLVYRKLMRLSKAAVYEGLSGKVINIMSNDLARFDIALCFLHDVWKGPMEALMFAVVIYLEIGLATVVGMAFLLSFIPLQAYIGKKAAQLRLKTTKRTDFRVKIMNEIILGIQVIKMYTWEKSFAVMVDKIRKKEVNAIRGTAYIRATLFSFGMISRLSIFLSLISYIYFGDIITARKVYIVSASYNVLNLSMVYFWPVALTSVAEGYISTKRLKEFLLASEDKLNSLTETADKSKKSKKNILKSDPLVSTEIIKDENEKKITNGDIKTVEPVKPVRVLNPDASKKGVTFENATAVWEISEKSPIGITDVNLSIGENELCAIVGQVGAGKTTLLQVIIGELELDSGQVTIDGRISYAGQEPWLFEGSVRNNITFIEDYDEKRYKQVVRVCALEKDFKLFPNGDSTIVGERGISLSGGQKARVNLARAIYKKADIYILDDPLSAVDTHVGKHIFDECIKEFLSDKVCLLVTHQLQYLKDVKRIVIMNQGKIEADGSFEELQKIPGETFLSMHSVSEEERNEDETKTKYERQRSVSISSVSGTEDGFADRQETQIVGAVKFDIYKSYFKSIQSTIYIWFLVVMFLLAQIGVSCVDYFVAQWVNWEEDVAVLRSKTEMNLNTTALPIINVTQIDDKLNATNTIRINPDDVVWQRERYIIVYAVLMAVATYIYVHRTFAFFNMCLRASIKLHDKLFRGITRATMFFYNNNPSGRILNRFSKDINSIDSLLPPALMDCLSFFLEFVAAIVLVTIANYWLLIPTVIMIGIFIGVRHVYINTARSVKRVESLTRSPIYSHTNATLQGLSTIRVFQAQDILEKEFYEHADHNTSAWFLVTSATRAFAMWLDLVCCIYIACVTLSFLVIDNNNSSGNIGLAILQSVNLIGMCQWGMRQTAEIENQMTCVERVLEYGDLPSEPPLQTIPKHCPPMDWPHSGKITFSDLNFRYSSNGNFVLKNLNIEIEPKEKIGIVGRTGAGKSSLIQALFRLADLDGSILIDEIDINKLGLHDLRNKISIIPQDPVLFSGTLRFNLDPFDEKKDEDMWNALEQVELKPMISSLIGGLDCKMSDGGSNFSMGQRQLVCLARAILRNNKILILDEATANVDPETDKLIQTTIRNKFADCTVLTIAHRLHTIMDSDRVLVIDSGQMVEFGQPHDLLQISDGFFSQLVDQTGSATAAVLKQVAAQSYQQKQIQSS